MKRAMTKRWMLALCLGWLTVAWADATLGAAVAQQQSAHRDAAVATLSASHEHRSSDMRESERVEMLATQQRGFGRDQSGLFATLPHRNEHAAAGPAGRAHSNATLQRRRIDGAQIGRFANPPPSLRLA